MNSTNKEAEVSEQENETTQQERDAAVIAKWREAVEHENRHIADGSIPHSGLKYTTPFVEMEAAFNAALRTIDRLTAERDAARAENVRLREAFDELAATNIAIYDGHVSVGQTEDDVTASVWGAAGREIRAILEGNRP